MMRVFDLMSLFRERPLQAFGDAPFMLPGSVSPDDQDAVLVLLQQHGAGRPLRLVELDLPLGLLENSRSLLQRLIAGEQTHDVMIVVRGVHERRIMDAVVDDPALQAFPFVAIVVPHPGGEEQLGLWGELLRTVREAAQAEYIARADVLGMPPELLDVWQGLLLRLSNPCDYLQVINDLVRLALEGGMGERVRATVHRRLIERALRWRPPAELLTLLGLATNHRKWAVEVIGKESFEECCGRLQAQGLWHPEDGLLDWASALVDRDAWSGLFGREGVLPTALQRVEGWGARHDEFVVRSEFRWRDPMPADASPFIRDAEFALQRLDDGETQEVTALTEELGRRFAVEGQSPAAAWRYLALRGSVSAFQQRYAVAAEYYREALDQARLAGEGTRTGADLYVNLARMLINGDAFAAGIAAVDAACTNPQGAKLSPRYEGVLLRLKGVALRDLRRHDDARRVLAESLRLSIEGGSSLLGLSMTRVDVGWNEAMSGHPTVARDFVQRAVADLQMIGADELYDARWLQGLIDLELKYEDLALQSFVAVTEYRRKTGTIDDPFLRRLRDLADRAASGSPTTSQHLTALADRLAAEQALTS